VLEHLLHKQHKRPPVSQFVYRFRQLLLSARESTLFAATAKKFSHTLRRWHKQLYKVLPEFILRFVLRLSCAQFLLSFSHSSLLCFLCDATYILKRSTRHNRESRPKESEISVMSNLFHAFLVLPWASVELQALKREAELLPRKTRFWFNIRFKLRFCLIISSAIKHSTTRSR
jgi:hypothetical protein